MSIDDANLSMTLDRIGGPLRAQRGPRPEPGRGQVRIAVEHAGVSQADVTIRQGMYPMGAKLPFVLGYDLVGRVDALGPGVQGLAVGDRVAAITVRGAYARYVCWDASDVTRLDGDIDPAKAVCLLLNYMTAYQLLHRAAEVRAGETVFVTSAAGGVGSAILELARLADVRVIGSTSTAKLELVRSLGAEPVDRLQDDVAARVRALCPDGVDVALDAVGGASFSRSYGLLRRGGRFVGYGFTSKMDSPIWGRVDTFARFASFLLRPDGRKASFYGIMFRKQSHPAEFHEDLRALFELHRAGEIDPLVADVLPLDRAQEALERVERGDVRGKLVLAVA